MSVSPIVTVAADIKAACSGFLGKIGPQNHQQHRYFWTKPEAAFCACTMCPYQSAEVVILCLLGVSFALGVFLSFRLKPNVEHFSKNDGANRFLYVELFSGAIGFKFWNTTEAISQHFRKEWHVILQKDWASNQNFQEVLFVCLYDCSGVHLFGTWTRSMGQWQ